METVLRQNQSLTKVLNFVGVLFLSLALIWVKIPSAFNNFWAEDGTFYQLALTETFPKDFFSSGGGYVIFISRLIARIVALGPVIHAPFLNTVVVIIFLSFFIRRLYVNLGFFLKSNIYKSIISISVLLLPISNFDIIATGGGQHFQLIFITLVILLVAKNRNSIQKLDVIIVSLAILSDPLVSITFIPLVLGNRTEMLRFWKKARVGLIVICISTMTQILMVYKFYFEENRPIGESHSIIKTLYLFLDRVIGSTFIPHWGSVSATSIESGNINLNLAIRATISFIVFTIIILFSISFLRKKTSISEVHRKSTLFWLLLLPTLYWLIVGYTFNPEPRYAIFPGLSYFLVALLLLDHRSCENEKNNAVNLVRYSVLFFVISIWALSATPSERRTFGPDWESQILIGKLECIESSRTTVKIQILPIDADWKVEIPCEYLL